MRLTAGLATAFARVAIANIERLYPHKLDHLIVGPEAGCDHIGLHPTFYGSYDWHSAVPDLHLVLRRLRVRACRLAAAARHGRHLLLAQVLQCGPDDTPCA